MKEWREGGEKKGGREGEGVEGGRREERSRKGGEK